MALVALYRDIFGGVESVDQIDKLAAPSNSYGASPAAVVYGRRKEISPVYHVLPAASQRPFSSSTIYTRRGLLRNASPASLAWRVYMTHEFRLRVARVIDPRFVHGNFDSRFADGESVLFGMHNRKLWEWSWERYRQKWRALYFVDESRLPNTQPSNICMVTYFQNSTRGSNADWIYRAGPNSYAPEQPQFSPVSRFCCCFHNILIKAFLSH